MVSSCRCTWKRVIPVAYCTFVVGSLVAWTTRDEVRYDHPKIPEPEYNSSIDTLLFLSPLPPTGFVFLLSSGVFCCSIMLRWGHIRLVRGIFRVKVDRWWVVNVKCVWNRNNDISTKKKKESSRWCHSPYWSLFVYHLGFCLVWRESIFGAITLYFICWIPCQGFIKLWFQKTLCYKVWAFIATCYIWLYRFY